MPAGAGVTSKPKTEKQIYARDDQTAPEALGVTRDPTATGRLRVDIG